MKIKFYGYNTFIIESGSKKIAIDPGALFMYFFRMTTLIPKEQWKGITHLLITHGDPDHHWHADRVANASGAPVICNKSMVREVKGKKLVLGPRSKGVAFTTEFPNLQTLSVGETIDVDGISVTGLKATHGPLVIKAGPLKKTVYPGPDERIGWGNMGFKIEVDGKVLVNLSDSLLHSSEWKDAREADLLMIPIGGSDAHNTMDEKEALEAVKFIKPKAVIPCHYNERALFNKKYCPANEQFFSREVEKIGARCFIMHENDEITI